MRVAFGIEIGSRSLNAAIKQIKASGSIHEARHSIFYSLRLDRIGAAAAYLATHKFIDVIE